eukprot:TRINITY_DN3686_c0_g1_i1.p1 TRINITY_DN3686_c0_g1~~TRINITY_DN3686_c0_g1_i1.p1  ORF type:complete len:687 (-),score=208.56 TRINITY_DN3686_c0_g1_i1:32-1867(-)
MSPLIVKRDLQRMGVTVYLWLHENRQPIPDVPAVYFVAPTADNVRRICQDCSNHLYESYHLNFSSALPDNLMDELASSTLRSNTVSLISKVYDQYLDFLSLEPTFFTPQIADSYIGFNDPRISDVEAESNIDTVANAIFSVLVTLELVPVIRCQRGGASELVAEKLDAKLRDHLLNAGGSSGKGRGSLSSAIASRPVLLLLDRNVDLNVMMSHPWTYQASVHDLFEMELNRVRVEVKNLDEQGQVKSATLKSFDLDADHDYFWNNHRGSAIPQVFADAHHQLEEWTNKRDELKKLNIDTEDDGQGLDANKTKEVASFVSSLPELRARKKIIDMHTNIATALLEQITKRQLDCYFNVEDRLMTNSSFDHNELLSLFARELKHEDFPDLKSTAEFDALVEAHLKDNVRLLAIYNLTSESVPDDFTELETKLREQGADLSVLQWIRKVKSYGQLATTTQSTTTQSSGGSTLLSKGFSMFSSVVDKGMKTGMSLLAPKDKNLYVTRAVSAVMANDEGEEMTKDFRYFDSKIMTSSNNNNIPRKKSPFQNAIVFMVGGGNYVEYQNVMDFVKRENEKGSSAGVKARSSKCNVIYGCSEILTANRFLAQLNTLGKKT